MTFRIPVDVDPSPQDVVTILKASGLHTDEFWKGISLGSQVWFWLRFEDYNRNKYLEWLSNKPEKQYLSEFDQEMIDHYCNGIPLVKKRENI